MPKSRKSINLDRWVRRNQGKHFCACGCGQTIEIKRSHHKKSVGIPKFIKGHNLQQSEQVEEVVPPPKKSKWDKLSPEEQERRLAQLQSFGTGEDNPAWKGGRRVDDAGYIQILLPQHPFAKDGYVPEHRLVVEQREREANPGSPLLVEVAGELYLASEAVVHHIDEVKTNNNSSNLMLLPNQAAHAFLHKSPLSMGERMRRISLGIYHSGPLHD
jgi:hypothetical protein